MKKYILYLAVMAAGFFICWWAGDAVGHRFRYQLRYLCADLGCLVGKEHRPEACPCGEVDLLALPCSGHQKCSCGYRYCGCGYFCLLSDEICTSAQECRQIFPPPATEIMFQSKSRTTFLPRSQAKYGIMASGGGRMQYAPE